jgi:hypothetical protein
LLGVEFPNGNSGKVIEEALEWSDEKVYLYFVFYF